MPADPRMRAANHPRHSWETKQTVPTYVEVCTRCGRRRILSPSFMGSYQFETDAGVPDGHRAGPCPRVTP